MTQTLAASPGPPPPSVVCKRKLQANLQILCLHCGLIHIQIHLIQQSCTWLLPWTVQGKKCGDCEPAGGRFMERQEWLLAKELLCHCCRAKLVGITVQAAAVTRAVHSNHTQKENKKQALGMQMQRRAQPQLLLPACCCVRLRYETDFGWNPELVPHIGTRNYLR